MSTVTQLIADFHATYPDPSADSVDVEAMTAAAQAIKAAYEADKAVALVSDVSTLVEQAEEAERAAAAAQAAAKVGLKQEEAKESVPEGDGENSESEAPATEASEAAQAAPVAAATTVTKEVETEDDGTTETEMETTTTTPSDPAVPVSESEVEKVTKKDEETAACGPDKEKVKADVSADQTPAEDVSEAVTATATTDEKETADMAVTRAPEPTSQAVSATINSELVYNGQPTDDDGIAERITAALRSYNATTLARGSQVRFDLGSEVRTGPSLDVGSTEALDALLATITDERRLGEGGLLTAAGGWCAMSTETTTNDVYADRSGLIDVPSFVVKAGIRFQRMPEFWSIFNAIRAVYTETQDIAGRYGLDEDGIGDGSVGTKQVYAVPCSEVEELRLKTMPFIIQAGLLMMRAQPQRISGVVNTARIAHAHWADTLVLQDMIAGSTAVEIADQEGAAAPVLSGIELHARSIQQQLRTGRTVEVILPDWAPGLLRADLARRLGGGSDLLGLSDAQIRSWFASRGIRVQFSANLAPLPNSTPAAAASLTAWPTEVPALIYPSGTWAVGRQEVANFSMIYDQANLVKNDATVLFAEDAYLTFRRGPDASRYLTIGVCADGATHGGVDIGCDGVVVPPADPNGGGEG